MELTKGLWVNPANVEMWQVKYVNVSARAAAGDRYLYILLNGGGVINIQHCEVDNIDAIAERLSNAVRAYCKGRIIMNATSDDPLA